MAQKHAVARYKFEAAQHGDLSFEVGEHILILEQGDTGWWLGETDDGRQGIFPYNRVQITEAPQNEPPPPPPSVEEWEIPAALMIMDRINGLKVTAETPIAPYNQKFTVKVVTSGGQEIMAQKTMKDFRIFNHALNSLTQSNAGIAAYDKSELAFTEIPEWADNIRLSGGMAQTKIIQRAAILETFMKEAMGPGEVDYLIVYFVDPSASFSLTEAQKRKVGDAWRNAQDAVTQNGPARDPMLVIALYNWTKTDDQNISFKKGEIMAMDEESEYQGWWMGEKVNGDKGLFPFNYVERLSPEEANVILHPELHKKKKKSAPPPAVPVPFQPPALEADFGPGSRQDHHNYKRTVSQLFTNPGVAAAPRERKQINKYSLCSTEAFDELLRNGITIEEDGKLARLDQGRDSPKKGDTVTLFYSGFIWEPQKQDLLEFASSEALISAKNSNNVNGPLVFTLGNEQAIDGIEEAVAKMALGKKIRVTLTPEKAYQEVGFPPEIPGNAYLVYDLTLTDVKRGANGGNFNAAGAMRSHVQQRPRDESRGFMGAGATRTMGANQRREHKPNYMGHQAPQDVSPEHFKRQLTLAKLQSIVKKKNYYEFGINPAIIEEYLTPDEFEQAFGTDPGRWLRLPAFQRRLKKEKVGLA